MTVKELVVKYCKEEGYDGLGMEEGCSCIIDDMFVCERLFDCLHNCTFGYIKTVEVLGILGELDSGRRIVANYLESDKGIGELR